MNLHERVLSVLSCRYVDEVVIGAPWALNEETIKNHRISVVVHGTVYDFGHKSESEVDEEDYYEVPKKLGIFKEIKSPRGLTTTDVVARIIANHKKFQERNMKKEAKESLEIDSRAKK